MENITTKSAAKAEKPSSGLFSLTGKYFNIWGQVRWRSEQSGLVEARSLPVAEGLELDYLWGSSHSNPSHSIMLYKLLLFMLGNKPINKEIKQIFTTDK